MQIDKTGQPASDEDLQEAINCVETIMLKHPTVLPLFTVQGLTIRRCLLELQEIRKQLVEYGINFKEKG
ncbi:hypothetical protein LCGC14_1019000 [marine sediment metagenome]|uniref:Uncharacterized protein n=1 Tax=marine sediment metagenome TaxID=412755 RepID=A0A0F9NJL5_9ZZZZ